jgi:hypothetical protein
MTKLGSGKDRNDLKLVLFFCRNLSNFKNNGAEDDDVVMRMRFFKRLATESGKTRTILYTSWYKES